jgi:predicted RNA-binding Zn-ribbon protein involved in translation (DUF1610 family)
VASQGIICENMLPDGQSCDRVARIRSSSNRYVAVVDGSGNVEHVPWQTRHEIECPDCGERTVIVSHPAKR